MTKTHILEGTTSDGLEVLACGRIVKAGAALRIGRAFILTNQRTERVTCLRCRAKYAHYFAPRERVVPSSTPK